MMNKIKLHLQRYFFYDVLAFLLVILVFCLTIFFIVVYSKYKSNKGFQHNFDYIEDKIRYIYEADSNFFKFDKDGIAIVKIDDLVVPIPLYNEMQTVLVGIAQTEEQDECVGYVIVEKIDENLKFDTSHVCDMIDY